MAGRHQIKLDAIGDKHNVNIRFEDVTRKFLRNISARLLDFLEIASYVFTADCSTLRGEWTDAKREEPWGRDFEQKPRKRMPIAWMRFWPFFPCCPSQQLLPSR